MTADVRQSRSSGMVSPNELRMIENRLPKNAEGHLSVAQLIITFSLSASYVCIGCGGTQSSQIAIRLSPSPHAAPDGN
ncbi:hypothetical protein Q0601_22180 [Paracoccus onubensis]|uniref:hypothetical protein n=1 Tax=Paracoccus onubensis TaxID=1675788 RepID=UPI0027306FF3|nr:hypothetical protein [Paracoccus onubensis]MDP0929900.1 hypothetical protein [Paracoccus onubensis]